MSEMTPGLICLLGSGETLPSSGKTHEYVAQRLPSDPYITILETPAGFEPNSDRVAGKIRTFLERRLQNYHPRIDVLPLRKRGTAFSPDDFELARPILDADEILLGPGSPTYGARQLRGSTAAHMIAARHRLGGTVFLSSSSTLAFSRYTMAVYEIYKVGEDLHWQPGVDFFAPLGVPLSIVPHWNNNDGGDELDTSRCYMGRDRFEQLCAQLPAEAQIIGIDEHTSVILDFAAESCRIVGNGTITLRRDGKEEVIPSDTTFPLARLGNWRLPDNSDIPTEIWDAAVAAKSARQAAAEAAATPSPEVLKLVKLRQVARAERNWSQADALRDRIASLGWQVNDTHEGFELEPLGA